MDAIARLSWPSLASGPASLLPRFALASTSPRPRAGIASPSRHSRDMALRDMTKPYSAREVAQVALDADCTPDTVRLVLNGAPLTHARGCAFTDT